MVLIPALGRAGWGEGREVGAEEVGARQLEAEEGEEE